MGNTETNKESSSKSRSRIIRAVVLVLTSLSAVAVLLTGVPFENMGKAEAVDAPGARPRLFNMLAYANKIDTWNDEARADLVLRVKHNSVDPTCNGRVGLGATGNGDQCNLKFIIEDYGDLHPGHYLEIRYLRTLAGPGDDLEDAKRGAFRWAKNADEYYTIHSVIHSGRYDYLAISIEGNIDFWNTANDVKNAPNNVPTEEAFQPGGFIQPMHLYAITSDATEKGKPTVGSGVPNGGYIDLNTLDPNNSTNATLMPKTGLNEAKDYSPTKTFMYQGCYKSPKTSQWSCNGPSAQIGWDAYPHTWSSGQAYWGLTTDYGIYDGGKELSEEGVAPPRTFFVSWYNAKDTLIHNDDPEYYKCSKNTSFYYQWVALKHSQWVPVTSLTPEAVRVDGQKDLINSASAAGDANSTNGGAFNEVPNASAGGTISLMAKDARGNLMPAQRADGSIDFAVAKRSQNLDGYFKLVTWPITEGRANTTKGQEAPAPQCPAEPWLNPLAGSKVKGITTGMSTSQIDSTLSTSWEVGSAYYKYDIPRPDVPAITKVDGRDAVNTPDHSYAGNIDPVVSGTCVPSNDTSRPNKVTLFGEDSKKPINTAEGGDVNDPDTVGYELGTADCTPVDPDDLTKGGSWSIQDKNSAYPAGEANKSLSTRRYHAWMTEPVSGFEMASYLSNIAETRFTPDPDDAPMVDKITVPHTKDGELQEGSLVTVEGTATPKYLKSTTMKSVDSQLSISMKQQSSGKVTDLAKTPQGSFLKAATTKTDQGSSGAKLQVKPAKDEGTWSWKLTIDPSLFLKATDGTDDSQVYAFQAKLTNPGGKDSPLGNRTARVDMTPTDPGMTEADWHRVTGKAVVKGTDIPERGAKLTVAWPKDKDGTSETADVTTSADGSWTLDTPGGLNPGNVTVVAVDTDGNESGPCTRELDVVPPQPALPFTGGRIWAGLLLAAIILLSAAYGLTRKYDRNSLGLVAY